MGVYRIYVQVEDLLRLISNRLHPVYRVHIGFGILYFELGASLLINHSHNGFLGTYGLICHLIIHFLNINFKLSFHVHSPKSLYSCQDIREGLVKFLRRKIREFRP